MKLTRILVPPVFEDEAKSHQAFLLHVVLWSMVLVPIPYWTYTLISHPSNVPRVSIQALAGEGVNFLLIWMMRAGHVRWASRLQVGALWLFMTVTALTSAGVHSQAYQTGYCLVVVLAGMLLGFRVALAVGLLSASFGYLMLRAEAGGYIHFAPPDPPASVWIVGAVLFPVIAVAQYLAQREMRRALRIARDNGLRAQTLSDAAFEGLMIHDRGVIIDANQRFAEIFGYASPADLLGRRGLDFMLSEESRVRVHERMTAGGDVPLQVTAIRRDGSTFPGETHGRSLEYMGRTLRIVAMRDISDRLQAEQDRIRFRERMGQVQKLELVGRLAAGVAHDFNNLLTCISGNATLLRQTKPLSRDQGELLDSLQRAAESGSRLTGQLLAMGRQQDVARQILNVNDVVAGLHSVLLRLVGNDVKLEFDLAEALGPVDVDPGQVEQILVNLCVNARDAMSSGGVLTVRSREVQIGPDDCREHPDATPGPYVCVEVADAGAGMAPDVMARIFEPFFTTKPPGQGTGLGLAAVYGIVRQNAGFVAVSSDVGVGSVFAVHLPRAQATPGRV
ncbi:MAG: PAS domain S-box protein [Polyangiaceae bacterium]|nr:PAS domain S-box protein [Polyangiaceae bacterium]